MVVFISIKAKGTARPLHNLPQATRSSEGLLETALCPSLWLFVSGVLCREPHLFSCLLPDS